MKSKVSIVKCKNYDPSLVQWAVKKAIELLGGITGYIKPQSKVLVKPNLLMAKEPEAGITTHPEVMRAVIKALKEINCRVFLGDGPSVWGNHAENIAETYEKSGMKKIAQEEDIELVKFDKRRWRGKFPLTTWLDDCDHLVSVPKFKTHDFTILTGAIKNLYGLVSGTYKTEIHKKYFDNLDFANILADIYEQAKPALTIVDGIVAMEGDGPATSGKLRNLGLVIAGPEAVALDSVLALIMGLEPFDILSTKVAAQRQLGVADINSIQICGERLEDVIVGEFKLPSTSLKSKIPRPIIEIAKKLIHFYPKINYNNCTLCAACVGACPGKVMSIKSKRLTIDYSGCISCFCCQEACPYSAIKVKKSIVAKMVGL
jgi:uncharacterized protein (DUF362 family)/NAD-dependent dihydropyrimidine dehydrogenase PreA subunit